MSIRNRSLWQIAVLLISDKKGNDGLYSILASLDYYIHGDDLNLMVNYNKHLVGFRQANPEFGEEQFDEVIGRVQLMF